ncbi:hypothetical protein [Bradyrhizobium elkanii]|uniref:hypothetical protein n=1 Tax=Bradyrhizobium elkanii TaxID=29448 RepID=UPI0006852E26|nr:hypothetical protein [Bradyrhizobium elkanii]WLA85182.1 hypothetical protein QNJ99_13720 [Bradyrhizobium elkanii]
MVELGLLRTFAAGAAIVAAAMVAANVNARITVAGFAIFTTASIAWLGDGLLKSKSSLVIQNALLLLVNILGVWRWLPRAEKEAKRSGHERARSLVKD